MPIILIRVTQKHILNTIPSTQYNDYRIYLVHTTSTSPLIVIFQFYTAV